jgi:uncharacterized protein (TIRG00374 family)
MRSRIKIILSFTVSAVFILLSIRGVRWDEFRDVLTKIPPVNISILILINIVLVFIRPFRWKFILSNIHRARYRHCFNYTNIGFLANNVLPARAGEFIRPILFAQKLHLSKVTAITTIVIERLLDFVVLLSFLLYAFLIIDMPMWTKRGGAALIGVTVFFLVLFVFLSRREGAEHSFTYNIPFIPVKIKNFIENKYASFRHGLLIFRDTKDIATTLLVTVLVWFGYVLSILVILSAFSYDINPIDASIVMMVFVSLSIMIPSSPGHFGTFQYASILALGLYNIPKTDALAISLLVQIPIYLVNVVFGVTSLFWEGVSLDLGRTRLDVTGNADADGRSV